MSYRQNLSRNEALAFIENDSISLIERHFGSAESDGGISEPDAGYISGLQRLLKLPAANRSFFLEKIQRPGFAGDDFRQFSEFSARGRKIRAKRMRFIRVFAIKE